MSPRNFPKFLREKDTISSSLERALCAKCRKHGDEFRPIDLKHFFWADLGSENEPGGETCWTNAFTNACFKLNMSSNGSKAMHDFM
mmetsp:Transcript_54409/g.80742  ORF Transcript_54409/g.80742 Transcript_54409/m.80742 type:complete len:86 (+) Transcript_54409:689-946(+)